MPSKKGVKKPIEQFDEEPKSKNDLTALVMHMQQYPWHYAAAGLFIVVCVIAGVLYAGYVSMRDEQLAADYMRALDAEEPADQVALLAELTDRPGALQAEIHYMLGERAFEIGDYEQAREAFTAVREGFAASPFAADATEGLGYVLEDADEDYEGAKALYQEIIDRWPDSLAAIRQPLNIARCHEELGQLDEAIASYRDQINVFAGSHVARRAQEALNRLRSSHPDLFPDEVVPVTAEPEEEVEDLEPVDPMPEILPENEPESIVTEEESAEEPEQPGLRLQLPDADSILFEEEDGNALEEPAAIEHQELQLPDTTPDDE